MSLFNDTYNRFAGKKVQRIEAISDGVFAVALTLLVLDIKVPPTAGIKTETELVAAFCALTPKLLTYFLSFMTLGIFWTGQTAQYNFIEKSDRDLNWIALFFLLVVSLLPFTTAFLGEHFNFHFSVGLYWLNIFLLGLMLYIHWNYAYKNGYVTVPEAERSAINKAVRMRIITAQCMYAAAALLCFISNYLSIFIIIAIQLNYAFVFFRRRNKTSVHPKL